EQALELQPHSLEIVEALVAIYEGEERHEEVVRVLETILETEPVGELLGSLHVRLASVWSERFADEDKARHHLEAAVETNPEDKRALWPLARHYVEREIWTSAMPLLDVLADQLTEEDETELRARAHAYLARCAEELLDDERAFEEYVLARDLAPDDPEVLLGLGLVAARQGQDELAQEALETTVNMGPEVLNETQMRVALLRLGECAFKAGDLEKAKARLEEVIAAEPENLEALQTVEAVLEAHGDWAEVVALRQRRLDGLQDPLERFQLLMNLGDTYRDELSDVTEAIRCYEGALNEGVSSKAPILQMVDLHAKAGAFSDAIRWLEKLIDDDEEPPRKALYAMSIAVMYRDEIGDVEQAVKYLNQVLDHDLEKLDAFRSIDEILTRAREWDSLLANYDQMIARVTKPDTTVEDLNPLLFMLHRGRGEILRSRLKRPEEAVGAYERARDLRPDDLELAEILADLYDTHTPPHP
ncbi:MAG: tetratricopeptide repeat protein, partial [Myxococcota bacterium]|nr:tetratricopeptide repeat protein [Myxococcota bacterium]